MDAPFKEGEDASEECYNGEPIQTIICAPADSYPPVWVESYSMINFQPTIFTKPFCTSIAACRGSVNVAVKVCRCLMGSHKA
ncbi:hypothetical protein GDO78_004648 [Eleutherodactylus coqui]|uniref:Uncharacterized protein n=1 Tax=Eleutherodactylus coqui TaxID=57060 RepID=A0A8J6K0P5_ELECQ|nr:hypothetical protein GDO78_004648 [Eleutherodactylus coqui]